MVVSGWLSGGMQVEGFKHRDANGGMQLERCNWKAIREAIGGLHGMQVEGCMEGCKWRVAWKVASGGLHGELQLESCNWRVASGGLQVDGCKGWLQVDGCKWMVASGGCLQVEGCMWRVGGGLQVEGCKQEGFMQCKQWDARGVASGGMQAEGCKQRDASGGSCNCRGRQLELM